jgi:hypothetical protein
MAQDIGSSNLLEVWASSGAIVEPDISKVEEGWQLGEQPPHGFMNWLQNTFGAKLNHVLSNGTPQWNSSTSYGAGSTVQRTGSVWIAMQPNSNSEPTAGNTNWSRLLKLADASSEATASKLVLRDAQGTAKFSAPTDPAHPVRLGDADTEATASKLVLRDGNGNASFAEPTEPDHAATKQYVDEVAGIGSYVMVQEDLLGATTPDPERYIKLEAGLTGVGGYNEGKLTNEVVTGSAPLVEATAEIADPESPLFGQVIHLLETEERFLRAGQAGRVQNDQMQRVTGTAGLLRDGVVQSTNGEGALHFTRFDGPVAQSANTSGSANQTTLTFSSANSPNARVSSTTDGETRAKNIGVSVYMRIK